jgi:CheY-like chemotaxis protein
MSGTQTFVVVLVLGIGVLALMVLALRSRTPATAQLGIGDVFSFTLSLSPADKDKAANAVGDAAAARGQSEADAAGRLRTRVADLDHVPLRRALWVDDKPDNNVYENLALARLGVFVTSATSNNAARRYLAEMSFDLVITDLGRGPTTDNGNVLIKELHADQPALPVIVYTVDAAGRRRELLAAGATAVEDEPDALIAAVLAVGKSKNAPTT